MEQVSDIDKQVQENGVIVYKVNIFARATQAVLDNTSSEVLAALLVPGTVTGTDFQSDVQLIGSIIGRVRGR